MITSKTALDYYTYVLYYYLVIRVTHISFKNISFNNFNLLLNISITSITSGKSVIEQ